MNTPLAIRGLPLSPEFSLSFESVCPGSAIRLSVTVFYSVTGFDHTSEWT